MGRCSHITCMREPSFNVAGKKASYCKIHADDGMVDVRSRRCLNGSCVKRSTLDILRRKPPLYCKQHADAGMVDVRNSRCSHETFTKRPYFNTLGRKTPLHCKKHANVAWWTYATAVAHTRRARKSYLQCHRQLDGSLLQTTCGGWDGRHTLQAMFTREVREDPDLKCHWK